MRERNPYEVGPCMCSECGHFEAVREFWVDDNEPGMVRLVTPCHMCVGQFKAVRGMGIPTPKADFAERRFLV